MATNIPSVPYPHLCFYRLGIRVQQATTFLDHASADCTVGQLNLVLFAPHRALSSAYGELATAVCLDEKIKKTGQQIIGPELDLLPEAHADRPVQDSEQLLPKRRDALTRFAEWADALSGMLPGMAQARAWFRLGGAICRGISQESAGTRLAWKWDDPAHLKKLLKDVGRRREVLFPRYPGVLITEYRKTMAFPAQLSGWCNIEMRLDELLRTEEAARPVAPREIAAGAEIKTTSHERVTETTVGATHPSSGSVPFEPRHSADYGSVLWEEGAPPFRFTGLRKACVKILWEHSANGTPWVGQAYLLEQVGSRNKRFVQLFSDHPAWGTMIISDLKGNVALSKPVKIDSRWVDTQSDTSD